MAVGYSGTPLISKLGIKTGYTIATHNEPDNYFALLGELSDAVTITTIATQNLDFLHAFWDAKMCS